MLGKEDLEEGRDEDRGWDRHKAKVNGDKRDLGFRVGRVIECA